MIKLEQFNDLNETHLDEYLITSFFSGNKLSCMSSCTNKDNCMYALFKANRCYICNSAASNYLIKSNANGIVYRKIDSTCKSNQYFDVLKGCCEFILHFILYYFTLNLINIFEYLKANKKGYQEFCNSDLECKFEIQLSLFNHLTF